MSGGVKRPLQIPMQFSFSELKLLVQTLIKEVDTFDFWVICIVRTACHGPVYLYSKGLDLV